ACVNGNDLSQRHFHVFVRLLPKRRISRNKTSIRVDPVDDQQALADRALFHLDSRGIRLGASLVFIGRHTPLAKFSRIVSTQTNRRRGCPPKRAAVAGSSSKALLNQLSSMPEGYPKLPRLLPQRQRAALSHFRNLHNGRLCARMRLELANVVF